MPRPEGEIRRALFDAARSYVSSHSTGATWRDLAVQACVGFEAARITIKNMQRAGVLEVVGQTRVQGSRRPLSLYAPAQQPAVRRVDAPDLAAMWARL